MSPADGAHWRGFEGDPALRRHAPELQWSAPQIRRFSPSAGALGPVIFLHAFANIALVKEQMVAMQLWHFMDFSHFGRIKYSLRGPVSAPRRNFFDTPPFDPNRLCTRQWRSSAEERTRSREGSRRRGRRNF